MNLFTNLIRHNLTCFVIGISLSQTAGLQAQEPENDPHFKILVSQKLGLGGFDTTADFKLYDENGFAYDAMSLLTRDSVKNSLQISDEQSELIYESWLDSKKQMEALAFNAIASSEKRDQVEAIFRESQTTVLSLLDDEQFENLEIAKARLAIEECGIAKYLKTERIRSKLDLTDTQLEAIDETNSVFKNNLAAEIEKLMRESNLALVEELSQSEKQLFMEAHDDEAFERFLDTKLFPAKKLAELNKPTANEMKNRAAIFNACLISKVREEAKIDSGQYKKVRSFRKTAMDLDAADFKLAIGDILTPKQLDVLSVAVIRKEPAKLGTVNSICHGVLGSVIGIDEQRAESLFAIGKQMQKDLLKDANEIKEQTLADVFQNLSEEQVIHLAKSIEASNPLTFSSTR